MRRAHKKYLKADRDQYLLIPPDVRDWVHKGHFARFLIDIMEKVNLDRFYEYYELRGEEEKGPQGRPPYDPRMMLTLIFYCMHKRHATSRKMEELVQSDLGARLIVGGEHLPDHSIFAAFRKRHREHMEQAFAHTIMLCHAAGLVDLKHVATDSTVVEANASTWQTVEKQRLNEELESSRKLAHQLLSEAEAAESAEEADAFKRKSRKTENRAERIQATIDYLANHIEPDNENAGADTDAETPESGSEEPTPSAAERDAELAQAAGALRTARLQAGLLQRELAELVGVPYRQISNLENGRRPSAEVARRLIDCLKVEFAWPERVPRVRASADTKAKRSSRKVSITDPGAYFIKRPRKGFKLGYLGQLAVCSNTQIVVAAGLAPTNSDQPFLPRFANDIERRFGTLPNVMSADSGYWDKGGVEIAALQDRNVTVLCPPSGARGLPITCESTPSNTTKMRLLLRTPDGKAAYARRAGTVEPVNARVKAAMPQPRFFTRGLHNVAGEWLQWVSLHNLLKLFSQAAKVGAM